MSGALVINGVTGLPVHTYLQDVSWAAGSASWAACIVLRKASFLLIFNSLGSYINKEICVNKKKLWCFPERALESEEACSWRDVIQTISFPRVE